ncbi:Phosphatidylinositol-4-phosphate 5-kinase [Giardia duodenalis assemblage B]|uniref:Phosphatidylinositol-4-phosphate 5-kinase n=1 Tax=Giardia duodenalis assemblage B TaxID=1394984 RepID=A0A132P0V7_GIAIN|nr:Phosphatidylinositol-4-phosphate 5-kinase [Giardia intestinalis assemblage B]
MGLLGKLEYDQQPYSGEPLTIQSPLYSHVRRVQQAIGKAIEPQIQTSGNPYSSETEGLMTVLALPGNEVDPNTNAPLGSDMTAIFYHASMFRTLMTKDSLDPQSLLKEFVTCTHPGVMKSPGKSPTFFVYGESGKYLIKQLKSKELVLMLKICASYGRHLLDNPSSLLVRIYAMFSITASRPSTSSAPHKVSKQDRHFIIIPNLFSTPRAIVERYDLKGSWVGRHTKLYNPSDRTEKTLKDTNLENYIYLTTLRRRLLIHQLKADSDWLKQHNLIDYSLLLGLTDDIPCIQGSYRDKRGLDTSLKNEIGEPVSAPDTPTNNIISGEDTQVRTEIETPVQRFYSRILAAKAPKTILTTQDVSYMLPPVGHSIVAEGSRKTSVFLASLTPDEYLKEIYRRRFTFEAAIQSNDIFHSEEGGFYVFSPNCALGSTLRKSSLYYRVVYMGIIDFLTEFRAFKHAERRAKGLCNDKDGISAVPSDSYANRFMRFCRVIFQVPISKDNGLQCVDCSEITIYEETEQ